MKKYILISLLFAVSVSTLDIITIRYECDYLGDGGPGFYGFPFIYRTTIPWVNSMSGIFYISGFLGNTIIFFIATFISIWLLKQFIINLRIEKILKILGYSFTILLLIFAILNFMTTDWRFEWKDKYFTNYGGKPLKCNKHWEIFYINTNYGNNRN